MWERGEDRHDTWITDHQKRTSLWFFVGTLNTLSKVFIPHPVWNGRELQARASIDVSRPFKGHPENRIFNGYKLWPINWHAPSTYICKFIHQFSEQSVLYWMRYSSSKLGPKKILHNSHGHMWVKTTVITSCYIQFILAILLWLSTSTPESTSGTIPIYLAIVPHMNTVALLHTAVWHGTVTLLPTMLLWLHPHPHLSCCSMLRHVLAWHAATPCITIAITLSLRMPWQHYYWYCLVLGKFGLVQTQFETVLHGNSSPDRFVPQVDTS